MGFCCDKIPGRVKTLPYSGFYRIAKLEFNHFQFSINVKTPVVAHRSFCVWFMELWFSRY